MRKLSQWVVLACLMGSLVATTNSNNTVGCDGGQCVAPTAPANTGPCTLQVTLNKADQGYTADLYLVGSAPDLLISNTKNHVGAIARRYTTPEADPKLFIKVYPTTSSYSWYSNSYNVYSDSTWAQVDVVSDKAKTIAFEDIPDAYKSDLDYNDVVVAVEKVNCGGDAEVVVADPGTTPTEDPVASEPPPPADPVAPVIPPGVIVIPGGNIAKVHANFLQATWDAGDLYLDANPPELLIAKGSNKKGASARNFFEEEEWLIFFLDVNGTRMYATDTSVAKVENITDNNYRIYFELDGDGDFDDAIVHIVLTPTE